MLKLSVNDFTNFIICLFTRACSTSSSCSARSIETTPRIKQRSSAISVKNTQCFVTISPGSVRLQPRWLWPSLPALEISSKNCLSPASALALLASERFLFKGFNPWRDSKLSTDGSNFPNSLERSWSSLVIWKNLITSSKQFFHLCIQ